MTPEQYLLNHMFLPHIKLDHVTKVSNRSYIFHCHKTTTWEVCRKCPTKCTSVHDHRKVKIKDIRHNNKNVTISITKRRFRCPHCKSVFTESVDGIKPRFRTTERYRNKVLQDFKNFDNSKNVAKVNLCSTTLVTDMTNERLELELRKTRNTPWGKTVLIDEHGFSRNQKKSRKEFVTCFVDNSRKILREMAYGRDYLSLKESISHIPGRENVQDVVIDMTAGYKTFIQDFFPNAKITVDKFHVLRLIHPAIRKYRKEVTGDKRSNPIRHLLLKNRKKLQPYQKRAVTRFCKENSKVEEVYRFKERLVNFYNIKGYKQARRILIKITDDMAHSKLHEIRTLRKTLMKWRNEILMYFKTRLTNARVEGFNRKCKLIQRKAYGFKNFENYRLRALYSCS